MVLGHFSTFTSLPSPMSNLHLYDEGIKKVDIKKRRINISQGRCWGFLFFGVLPIEERLGALAVKPNIIIQVQIVSIPMAWINL